MELVLAHGNMRHFLKMVRELVTTMLDSEVIAPEFDPIARCIEASAGTITRLPAGLVSIEMSAPYLLEISTRIVAEQLDNTEARRETMQLTEDAVTDYLYKSENLLVIPPTPPARSGARGSGARSGTGPRA